MNGVRLLLCLATWIVFGVAVLESGKSKRRCLERINRKAIEAGLGCRIEGCDTAVRWIDGALRCPEHREPSR